MRGQTLILCRYGLAIFIASLVGFYGSLLQSFWVPLTTAIVLQPTLGATLRKGWQRLVGTLLGIVIGGAVVLYLPHSWLIEFFLVLFLFLAYYAKAFNILNYGIFVVPLSMMVVMLLAELVPHEAHSLILARCYDTLIGAFVAVIVSVIFFPVSQKKLLLASFQATEEAADAYLLSLATKNNYEECVVMRRKFEDCLSKNRNLYANAFYEFFWQKRKVAIYKRELILFEELGKLLLGVEDILTQAEIKLQRLISDWLLCLGKNKIQESAIVLNEKESPLIRLWLAYQREIYRVTVDIKTAQVW